MKDLSNNLWFQIIGKINESDIENKNMLIEEIKYKAIKELPIKKNMLNLRKKHIPFVQKICDEFGFKINVV